MVAEGRRRHGTHEAQAVAEHMMGEEIDIEVDLGAGSARRG